MWKCKYNKNDETKDIVLLLVWRSVYLIHFIVTESTDVQCECFMWLLKHVYH